MMETVVPPRDHPRKWRTMILYIVCVCVCVCACVCVCVCNGTLPRAHLDRDRHDLGQQTDRQTDRHTDSRCFVINRIG
jgi:hypothetical protein